jgi:hypothetical protein
VAREFSSDSCGAISVRVEIVDRADIVETTACHIVAAWSVGAGHDPRRPKRDGVDLVRCVGIPDDQLSIL